MEDNFSLKQVIEKRGEFILEKHISFRLWKSIW